MDVLLDIVRTCTQISSLNLRFVLEVTDEVVAAITKALPHLELLDLGYDMLVTSASLASLSALPHLRELRLQELHQISPEDLNAFRMRYPECLIPDRDNDGGFDL